MRWSMFGFSFLWPGPGSLSLAGFAIRVCMLLDVIGFNVGVAVPTSLMPL